VGREADEPRVRSEPLSHELTEIELAALTHLGRARIT
jgi:hypothetical protein